MFDQLNVLRVILEIRRKLHVVYETYHLSKNLVVFEVVQELRVYLRIRVVEVRNIADCG